MSQVILRELKLNSAVKYIAREGFVNNFPITFAYDNPTQLQVFVGFKRVPSWELKMENGLPSVVLPEDLKIGHSITIRRATPADGVPHTYQYKGNAQGGAEFNAKTIDENFEYMAELVAEVEDYNTIAQDSLNDMEEKFDATQDIANEAMRVVDEAKDTADNAEQIALGIDGKAQEALDNSVEALGVANDAKTTALGVDGKAQEALDQSTTASQDASNALSIAQGINSKAQEALDNSSEALGTANTALTVAQGIDGKAQDALDTAQSALDSIPTDYVKDSDFNALSTIVDNKRDLDDNVFNGLMIIKSDNGEQGVGIVLQESDGTIRGSLVSNSNGIQITQVLGEGSEQSFTFPRYGEGGEVVLNSTLAISGDVVEIYKNDIYQPIFEKMGATSIAVKDNIFIRVVDVVVDISNKSIDLINGEPGNDYIITIDKDGNLYTQKDPFESPAQIPQGRYILGGFFFSEIPVNETVTTGEFATSGNGMIWTQADVDNIKGINKFSIWDLRFRADGFISSPTSVRYNTLSNHGMVFDNSTNRWYGIYHVNTDVDKFGVSRSGTDIASGTVTPKVPSAFGGNGTKKYDNLNWWTATELVKSQGSRLMWEFEFNSRAFGTTENKVVGGSSVTYPKTERIKGLTSKLGCEQVTGVQWYWGLDSSYRYDGSGWSYKDVTGGRGQVYTQGTYGSVRSLFGGNRTDDPANVGSRQVSWRNSPWYSDWHLGLVATRDLLIL